MSTKFGQQAAISLRSVLNSASRDFREQEGGSRIRKIPLELIDSFKEHPFLVRDDEEMRQLVESIKENGVLTPIAVREKEGGRYELISGHRRRRACELAGIASLPAVVLPLDDDGAVIAMVDANLQREHILPSEKAFAYKMKLDAMKRQGRRSDLTSSQLGMKLQGKQALDTMGSEIGESRNQIHRYIRLTYLISPLLTLVDEEKLPFTTAVALSYLRESEQTELLGIMESGSCGSCVPCLLHAEELKKRSKDGELTESEIREVLFGKKPEDNRQDRISGSFADPEDEVIDRREEEALTQLRLVMENLSSPKDTTEEAIPKVIVDEDGEILLPEDDNFHVTFGKEKTPKEKAAASIRRGLKALRGIFDQEDPARASELNEAVKPLEQFLADAEV